MRKLIASEEIIIKRNLIFELYSVLKKDGKIINNQNVISQYYNIRIL